MAKRKKYPRLPNGYGSIKYLGKNRRNPYAVHPPTTEFTLDGVPKTPKALCYVDSWIKGFAVLTAYKAGNYTQGMESDLGDIEDTGNVQNAIQRMLADYNTFKGVNKKASAKKTFAQVYEEFFAYKYERDKSRVYSRSAIDATRTGYKNCHTLHDRIFEDLRHDDLQKVIDDCPLKKASLELIVSLLHQMYAYAEIYNIVDKDHSAHIKINIADDTESGVPFSDDELKILWDHKDNEIVEFLLIMCYSGYRISAFRTIEVNLKDGYFQGGVKTAAGKNRIVPIHSCIYDLVEKRLKRDGCMLPCLPNAFRKKMKPVLSEIGIEYHHTPHDCRHTFSMLCEKYQVSENDRKRLLGHSFGADLTNKVYGHRSVEDLRNEIEKIKCC